MLCRPQAGHLFAPLSRPKPPEAVLLGTRGLGHGLTLEIKQVHYTSAASRRWSIGQAAWRSLS